MDRAKDAPKSQTLRALQKNLLQRVQVPPVEERWSRGDKVSLKTGTFVEEHWCGVSLEMLVGAMHPESLKC